MEHSRNVVGQTEVPETPRVWYPVELGVESVEVQVAWQRRQASQRVRKGHSYQYGVGGGTHGWAYQNEANKEIGDDCRQNEDWGDEAVDGTGIADGVDEERGVWRSARGRIVISYQICVS